MVIKVIWSLKCDQPVIVLAPLVMSGKLYPLKCIVKISFNYWQLLLFLIGDRLFFLMFCLYCIYIL